MALSTRAKVSLVAAGVVLVLWLWYRESADGTQLLGKLINPLKGYVEDAVEAVTGGNDVALEVGRTVAELYPVGTADDLAAAMMAIAEHESVEFTKFRNPKTGAAGVWQIIPSNARNWNVDPYDINASTRTLVQKQLLVHWNRVANALPEASLQDLQFCVALVYLGHNQGGYYLDCALAYMKRTNTWTWDAAMIGAQEKRAFQGPNAVKSGCWAVGGRALAWLPWFQAQPWADTPAPDPTPAPEEQTS